MVEGTIDQSGARRAYRALSFKEEKHALLAEAHRTLAMRHRWQHLEATGAGPDELERERQKFDQLREELRQTILTTTSSKALTDPKAMKAVLSIPELRKDCAVAGQVLEMWPEGWRFVDQEVFQNQELMARIIRKHGWWLRYASPELQDDKTVVLAAVSTDPWALAFASSALRADKEVVLTAVSNHPSRSELERQFHDPNPNGVLSFASADLRGDREVVLAAVSSDPWDLEYAAGVLKGDREVVLAALRRQTREDIHFSDGENVLEEVNEELLVDREIVLEAVRVDGSALMVAGLALRQDVDFVLQAVRTAPSDERRTCYETASPKAWRQAGMDDFWAAADSRLAVAGETAPVLSIKLVPTPDSSVKRVRAKSKNTSISSCEVSLLSGTTFTCSLTNDCSPQTSSGEPARKRLRSGSSSVKAPRIEAPGQPQTCSTVGQLASLVLAELPRHVQMDPLPERAFIVLTRSGTTDDDVVSMTPWDWNRPLSDFI